MSEHSNHESIHKPKRQAKKLGMLLIILSFVLYGIAAVVAFTPIPTNTKMIVTPIFIVLGEVAFFVGGIIFGKEVMKRYRKQLNPMNWFKKNSDGRP
ncbi:transporter suffix domain-containing protein [Paenibacillus sp. N1-5-1-14]|uniref:transporter suffix domain-containing protein n=1 Tax=Paenibacillus radicibacter TaxID=2972488 RepID=UPI0021596DC0|nr:transporter suffix domain-containing protein [Paenibacillus radicibacter]MCR8644238.1 transporter suffix domain-containing protein [Paenibacillus radicibacter]